MNDLKDLLISDIKTVSARRSNFHGIEYISVPDLEDIITTRLNDYAERLVDNLTDRFLGWKLPENFSPDAGITFEPEFNVEQMAKQGKPPMRHEPVGTNLLDADQAREMIAFILKQSRRE